MLVIKRDQTKEEFNSGKIEAAMLKAFQACNYQLSEKDKKDINHFLDELNFDTSEVSVEDIQDKVEKFLCKRWFPVGKAYMLYREQHKETRFIRERLDYMEHYEESSNAANASETDDNSNISIKNVSNLEGEVYKTNNRILQRQRMKDTLNKMFPEVAKQYEKDLESHIIYSHDEASSPVLKSYCGAYTLYPLMTEGSGNIDGVTPSAPNDIQSFCGQVTNLLFLLSAQTKGAVAFGDFFIVFNYYVVKEFGDKWYEKLDCITTSEYNLQQRTVKNVINKGFKQFIYGANQPAGNRGFQSPFSNLSYYDKYYFTSLFEDFYYPDGTQPEWKAIDTLQRMFMELHRKLRLIKPLTFPVRQKLAA